MKHSKPNQRSMVVPTLVFTLLTATVWLALAVPSVTAHIQSVDDCWHDLMARIERRPVVIFASLAAVFGGVCVTVPIQLLVTVWFWRAQNWRRLQTWLLAILSTHVFVWISKLAYARPRPVDRLYDISTPSFPSGHSAEAAVMAITLAMILVPAGKMRRRWLLVATVYVLFMAWTRTYLRVHWASDVTGGLLLGTSCALWAIAFRNRGVSTG